MLDLAVPQVAHRSDLARNPLLAAAMLVAAVPIAFWLQTTPEARAQSQPAAEEQPAFEVASVKPAGPRSDGSVSGGPGTHDPERFSWNGAILRTLLCFAYTLDDCQQQISGLVWIDTEKYEIAVKIPLGTTKEQFHQMLQNLLAERFQMVVHHETKQLPVYELMIAKNGPKLKESAESPSAVAPSDASDGPPKLGRDRDGFIILPPGRPNIALSFGPGRSSHWTARQEPISALAHALRHQLATSRIVIDKTGLTGKYDFTLVYDMELPGGQPAGGSPDDAPGLSIFDAVQQQLGLRLVDAKALFDVVVVDHAERVPTEN